MAKTQKVAMNKGAFEVKKKSDRQAVVTFPPGMMVGKEINADALVLALLKYAPASEVEGQGVSCCGDGSGACCVT